MSILQDVIKALQGWGEWKELRAIAARVPDLEKRVAALEGRLEKAPGAACPSCGALDFRVTASHPDPIFGRVGGNRQTLTCGTCGFSEQRVK